MGAIELGQRPGGTGLAWEERVNDTADSLTPWTVVSKTWATSGGVFTQSDTAASYGVLRHDNEALCGAWIVEARIRFPTSGQAGSGTLLAGVGFGHTGSAGAETQVPSCRLSRPFNSSAGSVEAVYNGGVPLSVSGFTINLDQFYKLRMETFGNVARVLLDGVNIFESSWVPAAQRLRYPFIYSHGSKADFDDIKVWTLTSGAPA